MAVETLTVEQDYTSLDALLWRRFGAEVPGALEKTLAANPAAAEAGVFLPVGMEVKVDPDLFTARAQQVTRVRRLW